MTEMIESRTSFDPYHIRDRILSRVANYKGNKIKSPKDLGDPYCDFWHKGDQAYGI